MDMHDGRNPATFIFAILALIALALGIMAIAKLRDRWSRAHGVEVERHRREREQAKKRLLDGGKHVERPDGTVGPKCVLPTCADPAEGARLQFVRDEGAIDFVRRLFGAPARLRVSEPVRSWFDKDAHEPRYCRTHRELAKQEMMLKLVDCERHRTQQLRDLEVELGHFERVGLEHRLSELVAKHEREISGGRKRKSAEQKNGNVLPFASSRATGTDQKAT